ncbi:hypothetical protein SARC_08667 [Sphaeroforma arctica JP610]|uniref:Uncharacterized protein n=1 Tax=Sphaeroforma arctica JP610 TaxID=667725 RepID=A0A0L0FQ49_9EUKA|nr:hypothetical protein SARC_08667 [Sphaeroforma arctica JP610]KNC78922.1 hypothetical protein SARC_08667 [Sphaeroforma arctica JP610]|eukprot:XP_014152824.1 hypothetical protein SARC_08667 [Sphaeroforma arctica JP610]
MRLNDDRLTVHTPQSTFETPDSRVPNAPGAQPPEPQGPSLQRVAQTPESGPASREWSSPHEAPSGQEATSLRPHRHTESGEWYRPTGAP